MWNVRIVCIADYIPVYIAGCPDNGIPAIDFRRAHGMIDAPTNSTELPHLAYQDERLCRVLSRRYPQYATFNADWELSLHPSASFRLALPPSLILTLQRTGRRASRCAWMKLVEAYIVLLVARKLEGKTP